MAVVFCAESVAAAVAAERLVASDDAALKRLAASVVFDGHDGKVLAQAISALLDTEDPRAHQLRDEVLGGIELVCYPQKPARGGDGGVAKVTFEFPQGLTVVRVHKNEMHLIGSGTSLRSLTLKYWDRCWRWSSPRGFRPSTSAVLRYEQRDYPYCP